MLFRSAVIAAIALLIEDFLVFQRGGNSLIGQDRKSVVSGKSVDLGGGGIIKKKKN